MVRTPIAPALALAALALVSCNADSPEDWMPAIFQLESVSSQPLPASIDASASRNIQIAGATLILSDRSRTRGDVELSTVVRITDAGRAPVDDARTSRGSFI